MAQEDKELLLKDLCARLPYGVKLQNINDIESIVKLRYIDLDDYCCEILFYSYQGKALTICNKSKLFRFGNILRYKPYLFPLSSMTEEHLFEVQEILGRNDIKIEDGFLRIVNSDRNTISYLEVLALLKWFYKNHFDIHGLIPMGLAIDATGLNIY